MKSDADHIFRTAELNGAFSQPLHDRSDALRLIVAKLWLLAAFVGMSLMAVAAELWWWDTDTMPARRLALLMLSGAVLVGVAWRAGSRLLSRAEREREQPVQGELPLTVNGSKADAPGTRLRSRLWFAAIRRHARA